MHPRIRKLLLALEPYGPERIYLFGSMARGEGDALSDLDVAIIKRTSSTFFARLEEAGRMLPPDLGAVDLLVYTPEEFSRMLDDGNAFAEMIAEEGQVIYERETAG
jgi:predicted nucleotidyltransferase